MSLTTTDGSKTLYTYLPETVPGTPVAGAYQTLRSKIGVKIDLAKKTMQSAERRSDRQEGPTVYGTQSGTVSVPVEWSYGTYDDLMEAVMGGTWSTNVLNIGNTVRTFAFEEKSNELGIVERPFGVQFSGFSISRKNDAIVEGSFDGICRGVKIAQTSGVNLAYDSSAKTITRSTAGFMTVDGWVNGDSVCGLGNTDAGNNNTVPWVITTLTDTVMTFTTATGIVTKTATAGITLNLGTLATSVVAASTTTPYDSLTGTITEGGTVIAHVTGWDLKAEQTVQPNFALNSAAAVSSSVDVIKVSGNLTVYYTDERLRKKYINGVPSSLSLVLGSVSATKAYTFDLGTVAYTSNSRDDTALARTETLAFTASFTVTDGTLKITRTP